MTLANAHGNRSTAARNAGTISEAEHLTRIGWWEDEATGEPLDFVHGTPTELAERKKRLAKKYYDHQASIRAGRLGARNDAITTTENYGKHSPVRCAKCGWTGVLAVYEGNRWLCTSCGPGIALGSNITPGNPPKRERPSSALDRALDDDPPTQIQPRAIAPLEMIPGRGEP